MSNKAMFTLYRIGFCRYGTFHFQQRSGAEQYCSGAAILVHGGGGRALECNLTGRCPFFRNPHNPLGKKFAFRYHVSELLDYKKPENNRGTIVYCS